MSIHKTVFWEIFWTTIKSEGNKDDGYPKEKYDVGEIDFSDKFN